MGSKRSRKASVHGLKTSVRVSKIFAYHRATDLSHLEAQQAALGVVAASASGTIVEQAIDVGPGDTVGQPGYARMLQALECPMFDVLATDMSALGLAMLVALSSICKVAGVEFWDFANGRLTDEHYGALAEHFNRRIAACDDQSAAIQEMLAPLKSLD
jgi:hypothetical protein